MKDDYSKKYPELLGRTWPDPGGKIAVLTNGMRIGFMEHVDTTVPLEKLKSIILLPGSPG